MSTTELNYGICSMRLLTSLVKSIKNLEINFLTYGRISLSLGKGTTNKILLLLLLQVLNLVEDERKLINIPVLF